MIEGDEVIYLMPATACRSEGSTASSGFREQCYWDTTARMGPMWPMGRTSGSLRYWGGWVTSISRWRWDCREAMA